MMNNSFFDITPEKLKEYENVVLSIFESAENEISTITPSEWAEKNRIMGSSSGMPGRFSFANAPYAKEILDCFSPNHPARRVAVMKGVQIGISTSVIQNAIGYLIAENPNNIMLLVGHDDLIKDSTERIDNMIDSSGLRKLLKSNKKGARRTKSGDTDKKKEFDGGYLSIGVSNHKTLRQVSIQTMIVDDFDAMKSASNDAGSTTKMIEARLTAFAKKMKLFYISTPELKETSNIEPVYLLGDQRKYNVKCPCCGEYIVLEWSIESKKNPGTMAGITWELDTENKLILDSVGYTCQKCGGFFDDSIKTELLRTGKWVPTAKPIDKEYYSYHISALYAPVYMKGWAKYVQDYLEANPINGKRKEEAHQTFVNLCLGETYTVEGESVDSRKLQNNIRDYDAFTIPEKLSIADGNGKIVMITCGSDLNGKEDDARLDWEIVAYSEAGPTYSVAHGSVGTFINKDKHPERRKKYSYRFGVENSVWPIFEKIISSKYLNDNTQKEMPIFKTGLDTGYMTNYAYSFLDKANRIIGLKGKDEDKFQKKDADMKNFRHSSERRDLYLVESNRTKDELNVFMGLNWDREIHDSQPYGFMNFPYPSKGMYQTENYFKHFESEHKIIDKNGNYRWVKKPGTQNHLFDCRLYANVVKDIILDDIFKKMKIKNGTWADYVKLLNKK